MDLLGPPSAAPLHRLSSAAQAVAVAGSLVLTAALGAVPYLEQGVAVERLLTSADEAAPEPPSRPSTADDRRGPVSTSSLSAPLGPPVSTTSATSIQLVAGPVESTAGTERAMAAYRAAAERVAVEDPGCRLSWTLLAGIGTVESGHGTVHGSSLDDAGKAVPPILGPALNGNGFALITDSDGGVFDGDLLLDRAVGPMQFIPTTWARWGADADGDGVRDPQDVDDAALAAGRYLCASGGALDAPAGLVRAVFSYNHSYDYVRLVLTITARYLGVDPAALGVAGLPAPAPAPLTPEPAEVLAAAPLGPEAPAPAGSAQPVPGASTPPATTSPQPSGQPVPVPTAGGTPPSSTPVPSSTATPTATSTPTTPTCPTVPPEPGAVLDPACPLVETEPTTDAAPDAD